MLERWNEDELNFKSEYNKSIAKKLGILTMIKKQFTLEGQPLSKMYFPSPYFDFFVFNRNLNYVNTYKDGVPINDLFDKNGEFYIIHPKEDKVIRNCANQLIKRKSDYKVINEFNVEFFKRMLFNLS